MKTARALFVLAVAATALPARGLAQTEGRVSFMNMYSQTSGPDASFDAAVLRIWMRSERLGGRNMALIVDARSDLPVLAATTLKDDDRSIVFDESKSAFNDQCRGDAESTPHPDCRKIPYRETLMGSLLHTVGIYDAFLRLGEIEPGKGALSIGRKTVYEAGLSTVDGLVYERVFSKSRFGVFGGLAPNPLTRMFDPSYQTGGGYYALQHERAWVRLGAVAQFYDAKPDRITLHNHDFWAITRHFRLAAILQFDVVPNAEERLVQVDLTYRPSGRYRLRASFARFRPWDFAESESHVIQYPEESLVDRFRGIATDSGSSIRGKLDYEEPEVLEQALRTSAINQVKLVGHYTTASSFTPWVSAYFRTREIDARGAVSASGGLYAYDPYDLGLVGRLRLEHLIGFDYVTDRVNLTLERRQTESLAFGGGFEFGTVAYGGDRDEVLHDGYAEGSTYMGVNAMIRSDKMSGLSWFFQVDYLSEARKLPEQNEFSAAPEPTSTQILATAGITWRFGGR